MLIYHINSYYYTIIGGATIRKDETTEAVVAVVFWGGGWSGRWEKATAVPLRERLGEDKDNDGDNGKQGAGSCSWHGQWVREREANLDRCRWGGGRDQQDEDGHDDGSDYLGGSGSERCSIAQGPAMSSSTIVFSTAAAAVCRSTRVEVPPTATTGCSQTSQEEEEVFTPEQAELWGGWRRDGSGQDFWGFKLSVRWRIAFICVLDGWRLDLLSEAYTSSWWPGERNLVVLKKVKVLS